jgi:hypothetical protein
MNRKIVVRDEALQELKFINSSEQSGKAAQRKLHKLEMAVIGLLMLAPPIWSQQPAAPPPARPQRVRTQLKGFDIAPTSGKAPNQIGGASRGLGNIVLYAPKLGKSYSLTPTFYWNADDANAEYTFKLSALTATASPLFTVKVKGGKFVYPSDAPALMPAETYVWSVQPENDLMGAPASASVLIVGGTARDAVEAALAKAKTSGDPSAAAKIYVENRLWFDAVAEYTSLIEAHPDMSSFYKERAEIYDQLPETQSLADADLTKAH